MTAPHAAYLEALGIPVWIRKGLVAEAARQPAAGLRMGPGSGQLLLLCAHANESAGRLAADIARVCPEEPVWAWPVADESGEPVAAAVDQHLFTTMLVFGSVTAGQVFGTDIPDAIGPARVLVVPDMAALANDPRARRGLWQTMCAEKLVPAA